MRVRTFKGRFAPLVKAAAKLTTIRPIPKRMPKAGDLESWRQWSGAPYHSKMIPLLEVKLIDVRLICINLKGIVVGGKVYPGGLAGGRVLIDSAADQLARADGFMNFVDMLGWVNHEYGLPFTGIFIEAKVFLNSNQQNYVQKTN